jgi:hypothetical protein
MRDTDYINKGEGSAPRQNNKTICGWIMINTLNAPVGLGHQHGTTLTAYRIHKHP